MLENNTIPIEKFNKVKIEAEKFYKSVGDIYCPYFKERINLNHKGLEHIEFKGNNAIRPIKDQYRRLKILKYTPIILESSHTLQGIRRTKNFEYIKTNSRWENVLKNVIYFEFIAILDDLRIRIILKQIENGSKFFWSIIPYWKIDKSDNNKILSSSISNED